MICMFRRMARKALPTPGDVLALEKDLAGRGLDQLDDEPAGRGLAAAGLAHEPQNLAFSDREADAVNRLHLAGDADKMPLRIGKCFFRFDFYQMGHRAALMALRSVPAELEERFA